MRWKRSQNFSCGFSSKFSTKEQYDSGTSDNEC